MPLTKKQLNKCVLYNNLKYARTCNQTVNTGLHKYIMSMRKHTAHVPIFLIQTKERACLHTKGNEINEMHSLRAL